MSLPSPLGKPFFIWNTRHHSDGLAFCLQHGSGPFPDIMARMGLHGIRLYEHLHPRALGVGSTAPVVAGRN
jgi:hypothetical protein